MRVTTCRPAEQWPALEFTLPELQYPQRLNAATALIDDAVRSFGADRPALLTPDGNAWSYGELQRRANQVAQVLIEDFGIVPGNRVMLRSPNNPWLVAAWLGVLKAGAVVVTIMPALRANEIRTLLELTRPAAALCDHRFLDDLAEAAGNDVPVLAMGGSTGTDLVARCAAKSGEFTDVATAADDVALLGPTSGTTGTPKITMHFHRDILANADTFARHILAPTPEDVFAGSPPLAFTFGLGGLVVFPLRFGAAALLTERATPLELAQAVHAAKATILFTAPTAYQAILKEGAEGLLAQPAHRRLGRRAPAGRNLARRPRTHRPEAGQRHRRHRNAARLHLRGRGRHPPRRHRHGRPRLPGHRSWTRTAANSARTASDASP